MRDGAPAVVLGPALPLARGATGRGGLPVGAGPASSQRDIAARLNVAPSLVVALVDQLADLGAVGRERSAADRRVQVITLTPKGRELLAESAAAAEALDAELRARLSPAGRKALATALDELELSD